MSTVQWNIGFYELLKAMFTVLTTSPLLSGYKVYDEVPQGTAMPYIHIAGPMGVRSTHFSAQDRFSEDHLVTIDVLSDYPGNKECAEIMTAVSDAISGTSWAALLTGYNIPLVLIDHFSIIIDDTEPTHIVRHGVVRYRFHLEPTS